MSMKQKEWTIAPLHVGSLTCDRSQILLMGPMGTSVEGAIMAWLLMNGDERILVDTGFGSLDTPDTRDRYRRTAEQTIDAQLARFSVKPENIRLVINTHLHIDHCGGNNEFENATFLVQKKELEYARHPLPLHRPAYNVGLEGIKFQLVDGDADVVPGVSVIFTPGHSPGSQSVVVETAKGPYVIAGDTIIHSESMAVPENDSFIPSPLYVDLREYYESLDRLKGLGAHIIPGHDMAVLKKRTYP